MYYSYVNNRLHWLESDIVDLQDRIEKFLLKEYSYQGPCFVYNQNILERRLQLFEGSFPDSRFFYSVKSLSNIHILELIQSHPRFGLDVVSGGEIERGLKAGFKGDQIVYAGVGKTEKEISLGLRNNIKSFHVESVSEIQQIERVASREKIRGPVTLRLNPNITVDTHKYIVTGVEDSKFGINSDELGESLRIIKNSQNLFLRGLQIHLGSQLLDIQVYLKGLDFLSKIAEESEKFLESKIEYLSLGGGFGIDYNFVMSDEKHIEFPIDRLGTEIKKMNPSRWKVDFEPGRFISAHTGLLLCHVLYLKPRKDYTIAITDAGMSELIRPALYDAVHHILPVHPDSDEKENYDIVGPICESGDFFAKKYCTNKLKEKDSLVIAHTGAYGSVMSSNYNSRPFVPEILVIGNDFRVIRRPQKTLDIFSLESIP